MKYKKIEPLIGRLKGMLIDIATCSVIGVTVLLLVMEILALMKIIPFN